MFDFELLLTEAFRKEGSEKMMGGGWGAEKRLLGCMIRLTSAYQRQQRKPENDRNKKKDDILLWVCGVEWWMFGVLGERVVLKTKLLLF